MTTADMLWPPSYESELVSDCTGLCAVCGRGPAWKASDGYTHRCAIHPPDGYTLRTAQPVSDADKVRQTPREIAEDQDTCDVCGDTAADDPHWILGGDNVCMDCVLAEGKAAIRKEREMHSTERAAAQPPALKVPSDSELAVAFSDIPANATFPEMRRAQLASLQKRGYIAAPECREATDKDCQELWDILRETAQGGMGYPGMRAMLAEAARRLLLPGAAELKELRADFAAAAGECMIDVPLPGTDAAKLALVNRALRGERNELLAQFESSEAEKREAVDRLLDMERRAEKAEAEVARLKAEVEELKVALMQKFQRCFDATNRPIRRAELVALVQTVAPEYDDSAQAGVGTCADIVTYAKRLQTAIDAAMKGSE